MSVPVRYVCPRCDAVVTLRREGYLADKAVTPYPLEGWTYARPEDAYEDADGVRFVCGAGECFAADGCGEPFYLSFVRYEDGKEVDPRHPPERVAIDPGDRPDGPPGPRGSGFY